MARNRAVVTMAPAFLLVGFASAWADVVQLDQQYLDSVGSANVTLEDRSVWYEFAQTFTVGKTGVLDHVSLDFLAPPVRDAGGPFLQYGSGDLIVDIRKTESSGAPTVANVGSNVLGSVTVSARLLPHESHAFRSIDFSAFDIAVTRGEILAVSFRDAAWNRIGTHAFTDAYGGTIPSYGNGRAWAMYEGSSPRNPLRWNGMSSDLNFRTYVLAPQEVPLPGASWMGFVLLAGVGAVAWMNRRRRLAVPCPVRRDRLQGPTGYRPDRNASTS